MFSCALSLGVDRPVIHLPPSVAIRRPRGISFHRSMVLPMVIACAHRQGRRIPFLFLFFGPGFWVFLKKNPKKTLCGPKKRPKKKVLKRCVCPFGRKKWKRG